MRISKHHETFKRGCEANFTDEVFIVLEAHKTNPPTYEIIDIRANKIIGTFYEDKTNNSTADNLNLLKMALYIQFIPQLFNKL